MGEPDCIGNLPHSHILPLHYASCAIYRFYPYSHPRSFGTCNGCILRSNNLRGKSDTQIVLRNYIDYPGCDVYYSRKQYYDTFGTVQEVVSTIADKEKGALTQYAPFWYFLPCTILFDNNPFLFPFLQECIQYIQKTIVILIRRLSPTGFSIGSQARIDFQVHTVHRRDKLSPHLTAQPKYLTLCFSVRPSGTGLKL